MIAKNNSDRQERKAGCYIRGRMIILNGERKKAPEKKA